MRTSNYFLTALLALAVITGCGSAYSPLNPAPGEVPPVSCSPGSFDCFEDQNSINEQGVATTLDMDTYGSTLSVQYFAAGSDLPGGTPIAAMRFFGNINANTCCNWPYVQVMMGFDGGPADWATIAPNNIIKFSYKAGPDSVGMAHEMRLYNPNNDGPSGDWGHFGYQWTPSDTNWHEVTTYLPGAGSGPYPGGNEIAMISWSGNPGWATGGSNIIQIRWLALGYPSAAAPYDMTIDDIIFE